MKARKTLLQLQEEILGLFNNREDQRSSLDLLIGQNLRKLSVTVKEFPLFIMFVFACPIFELMFMICISDIGVKLLL